MVHLHPHHRLNPPVHDDVGDCVPVTLNLHSAVLPEIQSKLDRQSASKFDGEDKYLERRKNVMHDVKLKL